MSPPSSSPALSPTDFSSAVTAITAAFGDPTRRRIYLLAHERQDGVTASEVAEACDLRLSIPGTGTVESLNVAAATAVFLATWCQTATAET